ncbi:hypothetical protein GWO13_00740 [Candidatus Bathyarchaeota archaeon]|nr:hypothetical protein [Candidatus Bathyarchaeota archaeon]
MESEETRSEADCIKPLIKTAVKAVRDTLQFGVRACDETLKILGEESG